MATGGGSRSRSCVVVCAYFGNVFGLMEDDVAAAGMCDVTGAEPIDLATIREKLEARGCAARWGA